MESMKTTKPLKPLKSKVSVSLDDDVIQIIKELADSDDRTLSSYINLVLKKHLKTFFRENPQYGTKHHLDLSQVSFLDDNRD